MEKASILVVDDDDGLSKTLSFVLGHKGYAVTTAKSGPEALEMAKDELFDIVFMDIKMPLMDGVETYKRMKKVRPETVVVMMTAYAVEELVQEALQAGAHGVIYKPLDIEKVLALIERAREVKQGALILVVDDDPGTCATLKNILSNQGYRVSTVSTGEEAIARVQKKDYDVIFIDMKLATINGLETYLAIKKANPETVAIMMAAYRQEIADLVEEALNNNAYACLHKPLDEEVILRLVEEIQERKQKTG